MLRSVCKRSWFTIACAMLAAMLAGCSSPVDPSVYALRDTTPKPGTARIVLIYPPHFMGGGDALNVELNTGEATCKLQTGSYMVREVETGKQTLKFGFCGLPFAAPFYLRAASEEKYYIRIMPYDSSLTGVLSGYPRPALPYEKPHTSPFEVTLMKEPDAIAAIEHLKRVEAR